MHSEILYAPDAEQLYEVMYTTGKNLMTADVLSRTPVGSPQAADLQLKKETSAFVETVISSLSTSTGRLAEVKRKQQEDRVLQKVVQYCRGLSCRPVHRG